MKLICRTCNKDLQSQGKNRKARYCDVQCANKYYYRQQQYQPIPEEDRKQRSPVEGISEAERCRKNEIWSKYRLDWPDYLQMYQDQHECCAICKKSISLVSQGRKFMSGGMACVDHCHTTGKVRGLLCGSCNKSLGGFMDNTEYLKNAIEYLENSN
jgi:hypothetical protein